MKVNVHVESISFIIKSSLFQRLHFSWSNASSSSSEDDSYLLFDAFLWDFLTGFFSAWARDLAGAASTGAESLAAVAGAVVLALTTGAFMVDLGAASTGAETARDGVTTGVTGA